MTAGQAIELLPPGGQRSVCTQLDLEAGVGDGLFDVTRGKPTQVLSCGP